MMKKKVKIDPEIITITSSWKATDNSQDELTFNIIKIVLQYVLIEHQK